MADPTVLLKQAAALYKKGERVKARDILLKLIEMDENNEKAWLLLSAAVDGLEDKQIALENVLTINPKNEKARKGLDLVNKKLAQLAPKPKNEPLGGSGWSQIDTGAEVESADDGWGSYLDDSQSKSPFADSGGAPATSAAPAETSSWDDDETGWGDLDASAVFTQAEGDSWSSAPPVPSTSPVDNVPAPTSTDEPAASSWGDIDTSADLWDDSDAVVADETPWGSEPATPSAPPESTTSADPWSDADSFSFDDDSSPWGDTASTIDDASPWGETPATPAQPAKPSAAQPSSADYDNWMDELDLKSASSSSTSAWGDTASTTEPEESSPWAEDAAVISDAWSDWGTGETPAASTPAPAEETSPWDGASSSPSSSPFSSTASESPFGEMPVEDMASSTSLDMDENPFDSPIDVNAPSAFTEKSSGGALGFGTSSSPFDSLLDEDDDDDFSLYADEDEDELESLSDAISDTAGRNKRLAMASSGGTPSSGDQYFRMIPGEIQVPPKRASQLGAVLTILVLAILNVGALGWLVSQLLG